MGDAQASGQQREGELSRVEVHVPLGGLEPLQAGLGRALKGLRRGAAQGFVGIQGQSDGSGQQRVPQHDGVQHRQPRA